MTTYQDLSSQLVKYGRPADRRKVANHTYLHRLPGGQITVRLHDTDVLTVTADDTIELTSGGWLTTTTKERINRYLPVGCYLGADRGRWYVHRRPHDRVPFFDGIRLDENGAALNAPDTDIADEDRHNASLRRQISRYVASYTNEVIAELVAGDGAGDCWFCAMHVVGTGEPIGDSDNGHLQEHITENYHMINLLFNALQAEGYPHPAVILHCAPGSVRRSLSKYLRKRLLTGIQVVR